MQQLNIDGSSDPIEITDINEIEQMDKDTVAQYLYLYKSKLNEAVSFKEKSAFSQIVGLLETKLNDRQLAGEIAQRVLMGT